MRRLVYLAVARRNLADTLRYITQANGNRAAARAFVTALRTQCERLAGLPGTLEVVAVLEGHRDIIRYFMQGEGSALDPLGPAAPDPDS